MAQVPTVNIKSGDGYITINKSDFNPTRDELFLKEGEILVKPLNVDADPFVIDEKDFDEKSYERVNATKKNLDIVAEQTPRRTLEEVVEDSGFIVGDTVAPRNEQGREVEKSAERPEGDAVPKVQTPQKQLKRNQGRK